MKIENKTLNFNYEESNHKAIHNAVEDYDEEKESEEIDSDFENYEEETEVVNSDFEDVEDLDDFKEEIENLNYAIEDDEEESTKILEHDTVNERENFEELLIPNVENIENTENSTYLSKRFQSRKLLLDKICEKYERPKYSLKRTRLLSLVYSPKYKLMSCLLPKAATTTWISYFLSMRNISYASESGHVNLHTDYYKDRIMAINYFSHRSLDLIMKARNSKVKSLLTVRHPLTRLVSAYVDKFANGKRLKTAQSIGHFRVFWKPAYFAVKHTLTGNHHLRLSFSNFIRYVLKDIKSKDWNSHWSLIYRSCSPCYYKYDYIIFLETFQEDLIYLVDKMNIKEIQAFDKMHSNSKLKSSNSKDVNDIDPKIIKYFDRLPQYLLYNLYITYKADMEMFGYQFPSSLMRRIIEYEKKLT